jgi:hypothetical protein
VTFQQLIQMYSQNVNSGHADYDIESKRQRRYLHILLNLAGNSFHGMVPYSQVNEDTRKNVSRSMLKDAEAVRWFLNPSQESDYDTAVARAVEILRNI